MSTRNATIAVCLGAAFVAGWGLGGWQARKINDRVWFCERCVRAQELGLPPTDAELDRFHRFHCDPQAPPRYGVSCISTKYGED